MLEKTAAFERNDQIWKMYSEDHLSQTAIARIFQITRSRVNQIILREEAKYRFITAVESGKSTEGFCLRDRMIFLFDHFDRESIDTYGRKTCANVLSAVYCIFGHASPLKQIDNPEEFFDRFMSIRYEELVRIRNMGIKKAALIKKIQDTIRYEPEKYRNLLLDNCRVVSPKRKYDIF